MKAVCRVQKARAKGQQTKTERKSEPVLNTSPRVLEAFFRIFVLSGWFSFHRAAVRVDRQVVAGVARRL